MADDRDIVVFSDEQGNEFELEVLDYFDHDNQEYAVLVDAADENECCDDDSEEDSCCECDECDECDDECEDELEDEFYIMKVVHNGDTEEFIPVEDDNQLDELVKIVQKRFEDEYDIKVTDEDGDDKQ